MEISGIPNSIPDKDLENTVISIKLSENGSPIKLYHMDDIPDFPSESSVENKIVNMIIFLYIL